MDSRVAVLEHIARATTASLERIERRMDALDRRIDGIAAEQRAEFRWLLGVMLGGFGALLGGFGALLGVMAHGFHWL